MQQFGLELDIHIADFVQQDHPTVGGLEFSGLAPGGASESSPLVAEQLALQQFQGQRRAVDLQEGLGGALRVGVNLPRQDLFADAAFAAQDHRHVGGGNLPKCGSDGPHARICTEERIQASSLGDLGRGLTCLVRLAPNRSSDGLKQFFVRDRLGQKIGGAVLHGFYHRTG